MWNFENPYYIPMAEEAINLVFVLCDHPDEFCEDLITDLHRRIVEGRPPVRKNKKSGKTLAQNGAIDGNVLEQVSMNFF